MTEFLIGAVVGVIIAFGFVYFYINNLVNEVMSEIEKLSDINQSQMLAVTVERHNGVIFCYSKEDNQFLCQGSTADELRKAFGSRFPDKTVYLDGGDPALVEELRKELKVVNVKLD